MDLRLESSYPATADRVYAMLTDLTFLEEAADATGAIRAEVDVVPDSAGATTRVRRLLPARVPDFARSFVGETLDVSEQVRWSGPALGGARTGSFTVEIAGVPVRMEGTAELTPAGDSCRHLVAGSIRAGIPFLGRKIEEAAADAVRAAFTQQERVGMAWLLRQRG